MKNGTRTSGNSLFRLVRYAHENGRRMAGEASREVQEMIDNDSMRVGMYNVLATPFKSLSVSSNYLVGMVAGSVEFCMPRR